MNNIGYIGIILFFGIHIAIAQSNVSFTDGSTKLPNIGFYTWLQKGVADMNADGLDDIVRPNRRGDFFILHQQPNGYFIEMPLGNVQPFTPLSVILGDVDNNGYPDILTGSEYNGVRIVKANATATSYAISRLPQDSIFTQASALADINNDGWLDVFVCNDDSTNGVWKNDQTGSFLKDKMGFDFSSIPLNKQAGNYGIVFTDFDNDGDLDAYLSKCRAGVTDSTDARRINQLFVNTNGIFTDQAKQYNLADSSQSWVTEFQDIDNDGDIDAFIANHHSPSRLLLNNGAGHFTDITSTSGLLGNTPDGILQALMRDFDNDGYVGIY
jgi:FG-GAP-like repeat